MAIFIETFIVLLLLTFSYAAVTICVEFGTSGSAFGVSTSVDKWVNEQWINGYTAFKVPSVVSQCASGETKFGFETCKGSGLLVRNLKLELQSRTNFPAQKLIHQYMGYLLKQVHTRTREIESEEFDLNTVKYVVTVPANWYEHENNKMKEVMRDNGIPVHDISRFQFIREPEAVAIDAVTSRNFATRTRILIIDAGAGTIDSAVFDYDPDSKTLTEIVLPMGNTYGSSKLDAEYFRLLEKHFGTEFMKDLKSRPAYELEYKQWLNLKHSVVPSQLNEKITIFASDRKIYENHRIFVNDDNIVQLPFTYNDVYEPVLQPVDELMKQIGEKILKQNIRIEYLFHAGGFANSEIYKRRVAASLLNAMPNLKIHTNKPEQSVINGCNSYSKSNGAFKFLRLASGTIGVDVLMQSTSLQHKDCHSNYNDGVRRCSVFHKICEINEPIRHGEVRKISLTTLVNQTVFSASILKTMAKSATFPTEDGISTLGTVSSSFVSPATAETRVTYELHFGVDIHFVAIDNNGNTIGNLTVQYV